MTKRNTKQLIDGRLTSPQHRLIIIEDHPLMCMVLRETIEEEPDLEVVGDSDSVSGGLELFRRESPDLTVVDLTLKDSNGLDLIKQIRFLDAKARMLVLSQHEDSVFAERSIRAGAMGYQNKRAEPAVILQSIRRVLSGQLCVSQPVSERLLQRVSRVGGTSQQLAEEGLSDRELEVFQMLGCGSSINQIADTLCLSSKTVETYRHRIKKKLGVETSNELIARAAKWNERQI